MKRIFGFTSLICIIFCLNVFSCGDRQDEIELHDKIIAILTDLSVQSAVGPDNVVMIINMTGCSVCYSRALYFLESHMDLNSVNYIITGIRSKKNLTLRLGKDVVSSNFVHLDTDNLILSAGIDDPYPLILYRTDGELEKLVLADLDNAGAYPALDSYLINRK